MRKLRIGIVDIVSRGPTGALYARVMNANLASIMPQVVGAWCREAGHDVSFVCYTGFENLLEELPEKADVVFVTAFTEAAHTAYALSNLFRSRGCWWADIMTPIGRWGAQSARTSRRMSRSVKPRT